jgi:ceramide glucosyltransferase
MLAHTSIWRVAILLLATAPLIYYLVAILAAIRFFHRERARSLSGFTPPASILKPVRGVDFASRENFESFCQQDYPADYEILFCVNDLSDSAVPLIHELAAKYPQRNIRIFSNAPLLGSNRKVNNLVVLAREARYEHLVQSDGDVRVAPSYLREMLSPFADKSVGVASCFYRAVAENNLGARLEAVGAASDFFAGAMVADWTEGVTFALGASVATTKKWLAAIGGYESIVDQLADDYELGNRIHNAGGKVLLSREAVWTMYPAQSAVAFWQHQVRWARTVRLVRPSSFFGLLFTHGLPWALLGSALTPSPAYLVAYLVLRLAMAWIVGVWGVRDDVLRRNLWLVPVRDAVYFVVWLAGFASSRVVWGGLEYAVRNGRMIAIHSTEK